MSVIIPTGMAQPSLQEKGKGSLKFFIKGE